MLSGGFGEQRFGARWNKAKCVAGRRTRGGGNNGDGGHGFADLSGYL